MAKLCCLTFCLVLLNTTSQATLVCPGGNLTLMCHTIGPSLRWVITFPYHYLPQARIVSSSGSANSQTPLFENPTLFQFFKISTSPLISTMLIDNITANLNGTQIDCWFNEGRSTRIIDVVGNAFQSVVRVESEQFQRENVTIILKWAQGDNEFYNASIIPHVSMFHIENTAIKLTLQYNTVYSASFIAFLCEYNTTDVVELHYVNCGMPVHVETSIIHIDYNSTWVNSVLYFRCKKGLFPTELFTATCLENGRWSSDPANHTCTAPSGSLLTAAKLNAVIATVSSITVCALGSLLFFVIGYACGRKGRQVAMSTSSNMIPQVSQLNPMTLYEEVLPEWKQAITSDLFELDENVAYDPLK